MPRSSPYSRRRVERSQGTLNGTSGEMIGRMEGGWRPDRGMIPDLEATLKTYERSNQPSVPKKLIYSSSATD